MSRTANRIAGLDALRGIAALAVVLFHYTTRFQQLSPTADKPAIVFGLGHYGVQLFFVISGWVILLAARRAASTRMFIVARATRLYPSYVVAMLVTAVAVSVWPLPGLTLTAGEIAANLLMVHGFLGIEHVDGVYWSLGIEVAFYAVIAVLRTRTDLRRTDALVFVWLCTRLAAEWTKGSIPGVWPLVSLFGYGEFFAAGMLLADARVPGRQVTSGALIVCLVALHGSWASVESGIVFAVIAAACYAATAERSFALPPALAWVGGISYPLYLLHQNLGYLVIAALMGMGAGINAAVLVTIVVALASAHALSRLVETPVSEVSRRITARSAVAVLQPAPRLS